MSFKSVMTSSEGKVPSILATSLSVKFSSQKAIAGSVMVRESLRLPLPALASKSMAPSSNTIPSRGNSI